VRGSQGRTAKYEIGILLKCLSQTIIILKKTRLAFIFQDLRTAIDDIHLHSCLLKKNCLANLPRYVKKDVRLPSMLERIRNSGRKIFLLTNSDWWYSSQIMNFLLGGKSQSCK
jgi:hypothetical protein